VRTRGQFVSAYNDRELCDVVRVVARRVHPAAPAAVAAVSYDRARAVVGFGDAPSARATCQRLRYGSWAELLSVLFDPQRCFDRTLGARLGRELPNRFDSGAVVRALRRVARERGTETLSLAEHGEVRERLMRRDRARVEHGGRLALPTTVQVETLMGSWSAACALANLGTGADRPTHGRGIPIVAALDQVIEAYGALPTQRELERCMSQRGIALARRRQPWAAYVSELRAERATRGRWTPPRPPARPERPHYAAGGPLFGPPAQREVSREACEGARVAFLGWLPPRASPDAARVRGMATASARQASRVPLRKVRRLRRCAGCSTRQSRLAGPMNARPAT
jgi:hypothetical protein